MGREDTVDIIIRARDEASRTMLKVSASSNKFAMNLKNIFSGNLWRMGGVGLGMMAMTRVAQATENATDRLIKLRQAGIDAILPFEALNQVNLQHLRDELNRTRASIGQLIDELLVLTYKLIKGTTFGFVVTTSAQLLKMQAREEAREKAWQNELDRRQINQEQSVREAAKRKEDDEARFRKIIWDQQKEEFNKEIDIYRRMAKEADAVTESLKSMKERQQDYLWKLQQWIALGVMSPETAEKAAAQWEKDNAPHKPPGIPFVDERFLHFRPGTVFGPQAGLPVQKQDESASDIKSTAQASQQSRRLLTELVRLTNQSTSLLQKLLSAAAGRQSQIGVANL